MNTNHVRATLLRAIHRAGSGHPGGSLSIVDILAVLYTYYLPVPGRLPPNDNILILSKGHAAPALYATLAECGLLDRADFIARFRNMSHYQGHPCLGFHHQIVTSTGSLGQGFSVAVGMAKGKRLAKCDGTVFVILGDGELQEGQVWEAAMFASHYKLDNIVAIIDHNGLQSDATNDEIMTINPLHRKWKSFGWQVLYCDGHSPEQITTALSIASTSETQPVVIIAGTIKGKGVSYMENSPKWHGSIEMTDEELAIALKELSDGKRVPVESSNLKSVGYNQIAASLEIEFKNGSVYRYSDVPISVFEQLLAAKSAGGFFHSKIRKTFDYEKVGE